MRQLQEKRGEARLFDLIGAGMDFCTVTVGTDGGEFLLAETRPSEQGKPRPGFQQSEERLVLGGRAWRRWEPTQPSRMFGLDYESWESDGYGAHDLARKALQVRGYATRQDYAFDYQCPETFWPRDILDLFRPRLEELGIEPSFQGPEQSCTVYLGSIQSDRRIKIYRRDVKDPALLLDGWPPQLRIEITLKGDPGRVLWAHRQATGDDGLGVAATHISEMTGWAVREGLEPLPATAEASDEADAAQMVLTFIEQHASTLKIADDAGIDVMKLARLRVGRLSRASLDRHTKRAAAFAQADPARVEEVVAALVTGRPVPMRV